MTLIPLVLLALSACTTTRPATEPSPVIDLPALQTSTPTNDAPTTAPLAAPATMPPIELDNSDRARSTTRDQTQPTSRAPVVALLQSAEQDRAGGQLDLAAQKLERALRIDPRDPIPWQALAKIRLQEDDFAQAVHLASRSNALLSSNDSLRQENWRIMFRAYTALGDTQKAEEVHNKLQ